MTKSATKKVDTTKDEPLIDVNIKTTAEIPVPTRLIDPFNWGTRNWKEYAWSSYGRVVTSRGS
ncbi:MAG: hypothetical protein ACTSPC_14300 [Candidatus Heimdallarchaeota archaeon]